MTKLKRFKKWLRYARITRIFTNEASANSILSVLIRVIRGWRKTLIMTDKPRL